MRALSFLKILQRFDMTYDRTNKSLILSFIVIQNIFSKKSFLVEKAIKVYFGPNFEKLFFSIPILIFTSEEHQVLNDFSCSTKHFQSLHFNYITCNNSITADVIDWAKHFTCFLLFKQNRSMTSQATYRKTFLPQKFSLLLRIINRLCRTSSGVP